jgi:hypothetical protein
MRRLAIAPRDHRRQRKRTDHKHRRQDSRVHGAAIVGDFPRTVHRAFA